MLAARREYAALKAFDLFCKLYHIFYITLYVTLHYTTLYYVMLWYVILYYFMLYVILYYFCCYVQRASHTTDQRLCASSCWFAWRATWDSGTIGPAAAGLLF